MSSAESFPSDWLLAAYDMFERPSLMTARRMDGGFSGAAVWRVETEGRVVAVRRWPPETVTGERLAALHRLLHHLAREGISCVAPPIRSRAGSTFAWDGRTFWQVEPWLSGTADFRDFPTPERRRAAMTALAQWHLAAARHVPPRSDEPWFRQETAAHSPAVRQRRQLIDEWLTVRAAEIERALASAEPPAFRHGGRGSHDSKRALWLPGGDDVGARQAAEDSATFEDELLWLGLRVWNDFQATAPTVRQELGAWESRLVRLQPCLRDLWHDHVLFLGDRVTGLIDPSAARTDNVAVDLARLLGSLYPDEFASWNDAFDDYARVAPMNSEERSLARALDRAGTLLNPLTWLERHFLLGRKIDSSSQIERLRRHTERLSRLRAAPAG